MTTTHASLNQGEKQGMAKTPGVLAIGLERARQIEMGYTVRHDRRHPVSMFAGAARFLLGGGLAHLWVKRSDDERDNLVRAGALIAAAIDRLDAEREEQAEVKDPSASAQDELDRITTQRDQARALHQPESTYNQGPYCLTCNVAFPCSTARALGWGQ